jgi:hypothetical protein
MKSTRNLPDYLFYLFISKIFLPDPVRFPKKLLVRLFLKWRLLHQSRYEREIKVAVINIIHPAQLLTSNPAYAVDTRENLIYYKEHYEFFDKVDHHEGSCKKNT